MNLLICIYQTYNEGSGDRDQGYEIDAGSWDRARDPNMVRPFCLHHIIISH